METFKTVHTKIYSLLFIALVFCKTGKTQNLVPNPSFEDCYNYPNEQSQLKLVKHWFSPYSRANTPDYFHRKAKFQDNYDSFIGVPENDSGFQEPKTGDAYVGIFTWKSSEVFGCELNKILQKDKLYLVTFYISLLDDYRFGIDNIGCYFSENKIRYLYKVPLYRKYKEQKYKFKPQITSPKGKPIVDKENWTKISGTFKAKDGEKYMYFGCFAPLKEVKHKKTKTGKMWYAYYLFDDISVYELDSLGNPITKKNISDSTDIIKDTIISQIENTETGQSIILKNIRFEFNKSNLLKSSFETLNKLSLYLKANPEIKIEISGHTDNIGSKERNTELSLQRAKSVNDYLIKKGVKQEQIIYKGYGSLYPAVDNKTESGRKLNRRVELKVLKKTK